MPATCHRFCIFKGCLNTSLSSASTGPTSSLQENPLPPPTFFAEIKRWSQGHFLSRFSYAQFELPTCEHASGLEGPTHPSLDPTKNTAVAALLMDFERMGTVLCLLQFKTIQHVRFSRRNPFLSAQLCNKKRGLLCRNPFDGDPPFR